MLKVFGRARSAHPLLDDKERVRVLQDIAALESHRALGELARWLRSVTGDADMRDENRAEIVVALDAQPTLCQTCPRFFACFVKNIFQ